MGRRAYFPGNRKRNQINIYLTDREYETLYHAAIKEDIPIAAWVRSIILREVDKTKEVTE